MDGNAFLHLVLFYLGLAKPETQTTAKERETIKKYASISRLTAEIGVYEGVNTLAIALNSHEDGRHFGIDPFFKGRLNVCYHELITKRLLKKYRLQNKVTLISKFSFDAVKDVSDQLDMIFIDGDHSWEGIKRDWEDWLPKIKPGGVILLHDTSIPTHDSGVANLGSFQFFEKVIKNDPKIEQIETVDSLNVLKKII